MSSKLLKVRSERTSTKYGIIWEIPNFFEACEVADAFPFQNETKSVSEFSFDTTFSPSKIRINWKLEFAILSEQNGCNTMTGFIVQWDFKNTLEQQKADGFICGQLQISVLKGEQSSALAKQSNFVLKPRETTILGCIQDTPYAELLQSNGQLTLDIQFNQFEAPSFKFLPEIDSLRTEGTSKCFQDFTNLLASGCHSDFCVQLKGGVSFKVHKAILAARSSVLSRMLDSGMEECKKGEMIVDDVSTEVMTTVLQFIYSGKIDEEMVTVDNVGQLVYVAEKYDFPLIKEAVNRLLHNFCVVDNAMDLWKTSKLFGLKAAEEQIGLFVKQNILEVFKTDQDFEKKLQI